jgi:hypothetical protein
MRDKNLFYISGFISFFLYIICFLFLIFYLKTQHIKKIDPFKKTTAIELEIMVNTDETKPKQSSSKVESSIVKPSDEMVKKSTSVNKKVENNVQSLFANVKTTAKKVEKKEVLNVQKSTVSSRYKSKFEKQAKVENVNVSNLLSSVKKSKSSMTFTNSSDQNDPYYSKVYEMIASAWNPHLILDNLSAKVLVTIFSDGRFAYRFLSQSGNDSFDRSLESFLQEQTNVLYPSHDKGSKTTIEIIFKSKE